MLITIDQLDLLRDMLENYDDEWLMSHIDIKQADRRKIVIEIDDVTQQDMAQLFDSQQQG